MQVNTSGMRRTITSGLETLGRLFEAVESGRAGKSSSLIALSARVKTIRMFYLGKKSDVLGLAALERKSHFFAGGCLCEAQNPKSKRFYQQLEPTTKQDHTVTRSVARGGELEESVTMQKRKHK